MKNVKVTYTVKPEFAPKNRENIKSFMKDFREIPDAGFRYTVYCYPDGKTFLHLSSWADDKIQNQALNVPSFLAFQKERDESGLEGEHKMEMLELVAASHAVVG
jgi:hypothetical protein